MHTIFQQVSMSRVKALTAVHVSEGTQPQAKHTGQMTQLHLKHLTQGSKEDITISQKKEKRFSYTASLPYGTYSQWSSHQELVVASQVCHQLQARNSCNTPSRMDKWSHWTWITLLRQSILWEGIHTFLKCEYTEGHLGSLVECSFPGRSSPMVI